MTKEMRQAADNVDDREIDRIEGIVHSMTLQELHDPTMIDGSRRRRIAEGSGRTTADVNQLLKQFREMQKMMKSMGGGGGKGKGRLGMAKAMMGRGGPDLSQLEGAMAGQNPSGTGLPPELAGLGRQPGPAPAPQAKSGQKNKKKKGGRVTPRKGR